MFWKKVVSLSHKTPTFGSGIADRKAGGQKKVLKTQGFSMFFFDAKFCSDRMTSPTTPKNVKYQFYLDETLCYAQKIKKTQYFWLLFGTSPCRASCLDIQAASYGFRFFWNFQAFDFEINEKQIQILRNPCRGTKTRRATQSRATRRATSAADFDFVHFWAWVSLALTQFHIIGPQCLQSII